LLRGASVSVSVAERGVIVYSHLGQVPRTPASNEKLLLSMALLDRFGPSYRIPTTAEGARPAGGSVPGYLWLVGHGDPELNGPAAPRDRPVRSPPGRPPETERPLGEPRRRGPRQDAGSVRVRPARFHREGSESDRTMGEAARSGRHGPRWLRPLLRGPNPHRR